jgi:hypothetical protein
MTSEELLPLKTELAVCLRAVVDRFNTRCLNENHEHSIETFDTAENALGIRIVKPQHPSCYLTLTFEPGRHPALIIYCSRYRDAHHQRETTDKFLILSGANEPLLLDDVPQPITADVLAERLSHLFLLPD